MKKFLFVFMTFAGILQAAGQPSHRISGSVVDPHHDPLPGAGVVLDNGKYSTVSRSDGSFILEDLPSGSYSMEVTYLGFAAYTRKLDLRGDIEGWVIHLTPELELLDEVEIRGDYFRDRERSASVPVELVNEDFIMKNLSGSFSQTLERLPGVSVMEIGSGQSKPVIRGLGMNRVLVAQDGLAHQGQEWGSDHGLEIDQYAIERVEVIKGPASLTYGSDAVGGVIDLRQALVPEPETIQGSVSVTGKSNSDLAGFSGQLNGRGEEFYFKARLTHLDYADYKVPADSIEYNSYIFGLDDRRMRNTAGNETGMHLITGLVKNRVNSNLLISNTLMKSGFFANAHGLEIRLSDIDYDRSNRDIDLPYHRVNHFKAQSASVFKTNGGETELAVAYQNNHRFEFSEPVAHGYMPAPADSLEREFTLHSGSFRIQWRQERMGVHGLNAGLSGGYLNNRIGGWGFIIPSYHTYKTGVFITDRIALTNRLMLNAGIRYDFQTIDIDEYTDWYETPVISDDDTLGYEYRVRAHDARLSFHSLTWSAGLNYNRERFSMKVNIGKGFRSPLPQELAADGVNYHYYRYEKGNPQLDPEVSYQLDLGLEWNYRGMALEVSPFAGYFPNYIYLNPTSDYFEGMQVYQYLESRVFRAGGEFHAHLRLYRQLKAGVVAEYVYSRQLSGDKKGFTIPFSPPASFIFNLNYAPKFHKVIIDPFFSIDYHLVLKQDRIVPPELTTPGYQVVNLSAGFALYLGKFKPEIGIRVQNLFNTRYIDHLSYYRLIGVPEPGRNFMVSLTVPFGLKHHQAGFTRDNDISN